MKNDWLEISDKTIDPAVIVGQVQQNLAHHKITVKLEGLDNPETIAHETWRDMIGETDSVTASEKDLLLQKQDCDVVPRHYVIDWRRPVLGPINAAIRRFINTEIRRFLLPSLEKQSFVNRQLLQAVKDLTAENERLRLEIKKLRNGD